MTTTRYSGIGVGRGVAVGPVTRVGSTVYLPEHEDDDPRAKERLQQALNHVQADLLKKAANANGVAKAVLDVTAQMAADKQLVFQSHALIDQGMGPAHAITEVMEEFCSQLEASGGYLAERVTDLRSVKDRIVAYLLGTPEPGIRRVEPGSVIVAVDISTTDIAGIDLEKVAAIVTEKGGPTGHTAIIATQMGLPCIVQASGVTHIEEGTPVAVDATKGQVVTNPDSALRAEIKSRSALDRMLSDDRSPGHTADGTPIKLLANIGTSLDAKALDPLGEGVGLFRTEILFLDAAHEPSIAEQTAAYQEVFEAVSGDYIVVRTLDAGSDKPLPFVSQPIEENPALGVRGYRLVRKNAEVLDRQLMALSAAAKLVDKRVRVMAPMVSTPTEARDFHARAKNLGFDAVGVMIEVPAAAIRVRDILGAVDFVSIGTNDLSQYTMAADRVRGELADLLDPLQPAVLHLVQMSARAGTEMNKPVGVCGSSASDPLVALVLVGLGVTSLSMPAKAISAVRHALAKHSMEQCANMAEAALGAEDAAEARFRVASLLTPEVREWLNPDKD